MPPSCLPEAGQKPEARCTEGHCFPARVSRRLVLRRSRLRPHIRRGAGDMVGSAKRPSTSQESTRATLARPSAPAGFCSAPACSALKNAGQERGVSQQDIHKRHSRAFATLAPRAGGCHSHPAHYPSPYIAILSKPHSWRREVSRLDAHIRVQPRMDITSGDGW